MAVSLLARRRRPDPLYDRRPNAKVSLSNSALFLSDLSPIVRNTNTPGDPHEINTGPNAVVFDGTNWRIYFEAIENTDAGGFTDRTGPMLAKATTLQGPWTISPTTLLITPNSTPDWENLEISPSSIYWDARNTRWVMYYHGGNNTATRQIGVMYSTDGLVGETWTRDAANPILGVGSGGSFEDLYVADLKVLALPNGELIGFYNGFKSGGPSDGTVGRVVGSQANPAALTKTGEVLTTGAGGSWNADGVNPAAMWFDSAGRLHAMFCTIRGNGGAGYFYSDDLGKTWTAYGSNPVCAGAGGTTAINATIGDGIQGVRDGDVFWFTSRAYVSSYATNAPLRGNIQYITPARVAAPRRVGKFFLSSSYVAVSSTSVLNQSTFSIVGRFRAFRQARTAYREIYREDAAFNKEMYVRIEGGGGADSGKVTIWYRTPTNFLSMVSTAVVDDGLWHTFMFRRNSAASFELYIDGVQVDTDTTNPSTDATATTKAVGNVNQTYGGASNEPFLGTISDVVVVHGTALTAAQANDVIEYRRFPSGVSAVFDFPRDGTENGNVVTVEAAG